jgi:hypothetical protein
MKTAFIYFKHTPRGLKFLPSYDLSPFGEKKTLLNRWDINAPAVQAVMKAMIGTIKLSGGFDPRNRPDIEKIVASLNVGPVPLVGILVKRLVYLKADKVYGERVMIEFND